MMSPKWRSVLSNWINCFFENQEIGENITVESLLKVVKHLHKNFCPDESKSSLPEATTLEDFITEKYPVFTFENGAVQISSDTEIYYAASLLLFFVCVNSKDANIKSAMCKNLDDEQQEIVLKFNKCLMECSSITYKNLEIAILDACGENSRVMELPHSATETPPALRSLHNEVQRLRAALDAERFDKNYLQEELARTNSTLTKVSKERDKYKEEILMLNSRIASDFEENNKIQTQASGRKQMNANLKRQLEELEQRLLDTRAVLEEVQNECDLYKSKVEDLQLERDKWVVFGETESNRVIQLTEYLEKEKSQRESLLQLVSELRQHNKQNGLDSSQLECDDPDVSVHSLSINSSTCNEMCANVVEVQLGEERARIAKLTEKLQALQDQMQLLKERSSKEKMTLEVKLLETTTEIENLKQQVNFEIKEKINVTESKNNEISKISDLCNELQQKMNDIILNGKLELENKTKEMQKLQEEKNNLIQSYTNEITRMENIIQEKDLTILNAKVDLDTELKLKLKLKDEYDTCILKLNQKLSDMDREVIELQNIVLDKTNEIKNTKISLQNQTELYHSLELQYSSLKAEIKEQELKFHEICCDLKEKSKSLECYNEKLKEKDLKILQLTENCSECTEIQEKLLNKIEELNDEKHSLEVKLNNTQSMFFDEKNELEMALSQKDAAFAILSLDLEHEIKIKNELLKEISQLKANNQDLSLEIQNKTLDFQNMTSALNDKVEELKNVILINENLEQSIILLNGSKQELTDKLKEKTDELMLFESNNKTIIEQFENSKTVLYNEFRIVEAQLNEERARVVELTHNLETLQNQMKSLEEEVKTTTQEKTTLETILFEMTTATENLKYQIDIITQEKNNLIEENNTQTSKFNKQQMEMEQKINSVRQNNEVEMENKMKEIQTLQEETIMLIQNYSVQITNMETAITDKDTIIHNIKIDLDTEIESKRKLKEDYEQHIKNLNHKLSKTSNEIVELQNALSERNNEIENIKMSLQKQVKLYQHLKIEYSNCKSKCQEQETNLQHICNDLKIKAESLSSLNECLNKNEQEVNELTKKCARLAEIETKLLKEISELNIQRNSLEEKLQNLQVTFCDEKHELLIVLSQKDAALAAANLNLEQEISLKEELHKEISQSKEMNLHLSLELEHKTKELEHLKYTVSEQVEKLKSNVLTNENLQQSIISLNKDKEELIARLKEKSDELRLLEFNNKDIFIQLENTKAEKEKENTLLKQQIHDVKQTYANIVVEKEKLAKDLLVERNEKNSIQKNMEFQTEKLHCKIMKLKESEHKLQDVKELQSQDYNMLKCQIKRLEEISMKEKNTLEAKLSERNKEIVNLMHQIELQINERANLTKDNNDEISKLNNQLNDMEQKMNDIVQNSARDLDNKMREIQTLKEENNTLIQTFSSEITKMERIIKDRDITIHNVQVNLDTEINSKLKLKEDYDKHVVNLNQKLSNRNNEIVELQTNLLKRSDEMESTKISLHKQLKMYHDLELDYSTFKSQFEEQHTKLQQVYCELKDKSEALECLNGKLHENEQIICQITAKHSELTQVYSRLLKEIDDLNIEKKCLGVELKNVQITFGDEQRELKMALTQKDVTLGETSLNLEKEISLKEQLIKQISQLKEVNRKLSSECEQKSLDFEEIKIMVNDGIKKINDVTTRNKNLEQTVMSLNKNKEELMNRLKQKCDELILLELNNKTVVSQLQNSRDDLQKEITSLKQQVVDVKESYTNVLTEKDCELKQLNEKLAVEKIEKDNIQKKMEFEIHKLQDNIIRCKEESEVRLQEIENRQSTEHGSLKSHIELLEETITKEKSTFEIKLLEKTTEIDNLKCQIKEKMQLIECNNLEISKLNNLLNETERKMNDIFENNTQDMENKAKQIQSLKEDKLIFMQNFTTELAKLESIINEKDSMMQNLKVALDTEINSNCKVKKEYEEQIKILAQKMTDNNNEVIELQNTLLRRNNEIETAEISLQTQIKMYQDLEAEYSAYKLHQEEQQTGLQKLQCELESKLETLKCLNEKLHEGEEKISQLTERCAELSACQTKLSKKNCELSAQKKSLEIELRNVQNTFCDKKRELEALLSQKDTDLVMMSSNLEREINNKEKLRSEISQLNDINKDLSSQLEQKTKELEKISNIINSQMIELEKVTLTNRNIEQTIISLNKDKEELMAKLKDKCDKRILFEPNNKLIVEQLEHDKAELEKENETLKQKMEDMRSSYDSILTEKDFRLKRLSEELYAERNGKTTDSKNVEMEIQKLHDEILKSNRETKFKLQEIKGLHSGEYSLLKTVFRELTNLGDASAGSDIDSKRSSNSGIIPVDKLEKSVEAMEQQSKKYIEKQISLEKERDKLAQRCRSNESDLVNVKKFLTELCVYLTTFDSVREIYTQKLNKIVSLQRIARREIHNLEGKQSDGVMCKLERRYAAIMQDLTEFVMNMERWAAKSIECQGLTPEIIKKAFKSPITLFCCGSLQNGSLNIQLDELNLAFQKLLEEISHIPSEETAREIQTASMMEIRAEYEEKLNRMKKKMKELYQEQIGIFRERQKEEIAVLEKELMATREKLAESSKAYEEHIRGLTTELWSVGEKFLMKKDEADWLRRRQHSGSLMSLQQMHSSGITSVGEDRLRASDTHSLRSLQPARKTDRRGLHMSDEEGEVFDNRCLRELHDTPPANPELRLSELRWRNSLCPPHLKSSYPAETQFAPSLDEDDIKSVPGGGGSRQRKEVGITAYKKPGPPTPSKQAGRLSATDSELRESLRTDAEVTARKTSTPSRLRALFRRHDTDNSSTPRNKRLSIFRSRK